MFTVKFKKLHPNAVIPTKGRDTDAGIDFYSLHSYTLRRGFTTIISTGIAWEPVVDSWYMPAKNHVPYLQLFGRSGLAVKHGIDVIGGVVDYEYRGEIKFALFNGGEREYFIGKGDRIGQGVVLWTPVVRIEETDTLSDTDRGTQGFGSSDA